MTVLIYVNTSKQVGDSEHVKVFANTDAAEAWFEENDPEGVAFEYEVLEWKRPPTEAALQHPPAWAGLYFKINHKAAPAVAVMATDITMDSAHSLAHSQYDTHAISGRLHCRAASVPGNRGKRQCSLCQSE
jgi:hypothetical protein